MAENENSIFERYAQQAKQTEKVKQRIAVQKWKDLTHERLKWYVGAVVCFVVFSLGGGRERGLANDWCALAGDLVARTHARAHTHTHTHTCVVLIIFPPFFPHPR